MRILALDISSRMTGWSHLLREQGPDLHRVKLLDKGSLPAEGTALSYGAYPLGYVKAAIAAANKVIGVIDEIKPEAIVIEDTNPGRSAYSQRLLEWIHLLVVIAIDTRTIPLVYVRTGQWRGHLGFKKPADAKKNDKLVAKARKIAAEQGITQQAAKKALGVSRKWNKKDLAVSWVNENYKLGFKRADNDVAEAICLGCAFLGGCETSDGIALSKKQREKRGK